MNRKSSDNIHRFLIEAKDLGLDRNHRFMRLYRVVCHQPNHPVARPAIERLIINARRKHELYGDPFDPAPARMPGQIRVGCAKLCVAAVWLRLFLGNCLCLAGSGAGKSNALLYWAPQLAVNGLATWTFELAKGHLMRCYWLFERCGQRLTVIRAEHWVFNLLEVPAGVRVRVWLVRVCEILTEALHIPEAAQDLLMTAVIELYGKFGVLNGSMRFPTLQELTRHLATMDANPQAKAALVRRLRLLILELGPKMTSYRRGYSIKDLEQRHLHFVLHGQSERAQAVIVLTLTAALFEFRNSAGPNRDLRNVIILEEGRRFLSGSHNTYISYLFEQVRETGIAFLAFVQYSAADEVLANCAIKILGHAGHAKDYSGSFGASMGLTSQQVFWLKHNLRPGVFVFKLGDGPFLRPFLVRVPLMAPLPQLTEEQVKASQADLDRSTLEPVEAEEPIRIVTPLLALPADLPARASQQELCFLRAIADNPNLASSRFAGILRTSMKRAIKIRQRLVAKHWATEQRLDSGKRGGQIKTLRLTDEGKRVLEAEA